MGIGGAAIPQGSFSCPCGAIHLQSAFLRFRLTAKTTAAPLLLAFLRDHFAGFRRKALDKIDTDGIIKIERALPVNGWLLFAS